MHKRLPALPLDPLRGFVAAATHLSFTRAAEELFVTQSAISRQVQTLESALGVPLFVRGVRSLALTDEGVRLARAAEGWLADYARLAGSFQRRTPRPVTVTATFGIAALWLVPRLSRFQALHPEIDVRVAASNRLLDLVREDIDLGIRYCADRDAPTGAQRLFGEAVMPVAAPTLVVPRLDRNSLPELTLLEFDDPQYPWLQWHDWLASMGLDTVRPRAILRFSHYDQLIQAAVEGQGIAIGREHLLQRLFADGRLRAIGGARRQMRDWGYWLVNASPTPREPVARFAEWLRAEASAEGNDTKET